MDARPDPLSRTERWPLDGRNGTLALAREHTRGFLLSLPEVSPATTQDALILVSELVSNAMRHAPGPCTLQLTSSADLVTIAVSDTSTSPPQARPADLQAGGGGFGWHLLQQLSRRVQVHLDPPNGKTVSAVLALQFPRSQETMAG